MLAQGSGTGLGFAASDLCSVPLARRLLDLGEAGRPMHSVLRRAVVRLCRVFWQQQSRAIKTSFPFERAPLYLGIFLKEIIKGTCLYPCPPYLGEMLNIQQQGSD